MLSGTTKDNFKPDRIYNFRDLARNQIHFHNYHQLHIRKFSCKGGNIFTAINRRESFLLMDRDMHMEEKEERERGHNGRKQGVGVKEGS